jgi:lambda repressor-like predicted transcriptional regulator
MGLKDVKKSMIDKDLNVTKLAQICGYTVSHVSKVLNRRVRSRRAEKAIALALNEDVIELWHERDN